MVLHGSSSIVSPPQVHISQVFWLNLRGHGQEEAISASTSALKSGRKEWWIKEWWINQQILWILKCPTYVIVCGSWKRRCEWWKHWPNENTRCRFVLSMWKLQYTYIITLSYIAVYIQSACCCTFSSRVCVRAQLTASSLWPLSCGYHPCRSRMLFKISWPSSRDSRDHLPRNHIPKTHPSCHVGFNVYIYIYIYIYIRIYQWDSMGSRWVGIHQPSWHVQRDAKRCKECQFLLHTFVFLAGLALFPMFDLRVWDYWRASGLWVGRPFKSIVSMSFILWPLYTWRMFWNTRELLKLIGPEKWLSRC